MATAQAENGLAASLGVRWEQASRKVTELGETFPAEKFESEMAPGSRTFGAVLRHIAFWNQYVADSLRGKQANDSLNELPSASCPEKTGVLAAVQRTSDDAAKALGERHAEFDLKTAEMVMAFIDHTSEHYGQLVVYTRLAGIVPPASRT